MRTIFRNPLRLKSKALVTAAAIVAAASLAAARAWRAPGAENVSRISIAPAGQEARDAAQGKPSGERVEAEVITLLPTGFEPAEITPSSGKFLLQVSNRSGLPEVNLQLEGENGDRRREVNVPRRKLDWREVVRLPRGTYLLSEANHPEWQCRIIIARD